MKKKTARLNPVHPGDVLREDFKLPLEVVRLRGGQGRGGDAPRHQPDLPGQAECQCGDGLEAGPTVQRVAGTLDGHPGGLRSRGCPPDTRCVSAPRRPSRHFSRQTIATGGLRPIPTIIPTIIPPFWRDKQNGRTASGESCQVSCHFGRIRCQATRTFSRTFCPATTASPRMSLNESIVEDAALTWFRELGYTVGHGSAFARLRRDKPQPGEGGAGS